MTVNGIASINSIGTDFAAGNFNISVNFAFTDGSADYTLSTLCQVPFTASKTHAEQIIRQALAAAALSTDSVTIDPLDIKMLFQPVFT
jgi:hypothetical protein